MRPLYLLLKFLLKYTIWIYYPRFININKPKKRFARTIFASNHAASFMDPLVVAHSQPPIVFFMTRSDVFTPLLQPVLWASHMFPIYRQQDGEDTKKKNEEVFKKCNRVLKYGRSLLVFAEGFTDDVFIRRLKPVKKGAVRIGFGALESENWQKPIYIQAVGVNYSDPNVIGSDVVISNSDPICLNDYKDQYKKDPSKTITQLTQEVERRMRAQITDVREKDLAPIHEMIMRFTRKGMSAIDSDKRIPLKKRWEYSRRLANWFNAADAQKKENLITLGKKMEAYFDVQKRMNIQENDYYQVNSNTWSKSKDLWFLIMLFPFVIWGLIHNYLPYLLIKRFVEKAFRRKVFWGSVKMMLGVVAVGIFNLLPLFIGYYLIYPSWGFWLLNYFVFAPLSGLIAYQWFRRYSSFKRRKRIVKMDLSKLGDEREQILRDIRALVPVA